MTEITLGNKLQIDLPWVLIKNLTPNNRLHWRQRAREADNLNEFAYYQTRRVISTLVQARLCIDGPVAVSYQFFAPDNRRRDADNFVAACKPACDGIARALGIDDSLFRIAGAKIVGFDRARRGHISGFARLSLSWE